MTGTGSRPRRHIHGQAFCRELGAGGARHFGQHSDFRTRDDFAGSLQHGHGRHRAWATQQVPLTKFDAKVSHDFQLGFGLDALGNEHGAEGFRKAGQAPILFY